MIALIYEAIGFVMAWAIKQVFWVPHRFRYGMLVAGGWGNVGDIRESTGEFVWLFLGVDDLDLALQRRPW